MNEPKKPPRRRRDPDSTRAAILEAAGVLLAKNGPEGLSVSQVAQLAKINRGTAYQHFQTREQLLDATTEWVSERLSKAVFGSTSWSDTGEMMDAEQVAEHLADFAMANPELGRAWLFEMLNSNRPSSDPFWSQYKDRLDKFAQSEYAQPGIDVDVHSVLVLAGAFLWPVWARAHARTAAERSKMAKRYSSEALRLSMYGTMRPDKFPQLADKVAKTNGSRKRGK